jgi:glycosyltransferase involved in cell wall biosynthesis
MKRVLFVGETPIGTTGNSNMLRAMLIDLDYESYQPGCFVVGDSNPSVIAFDPPPYTLINGTTAEDFWGHRRLLSVIQETTFDFLVMVGIDFWRYMPIWDYIRQLRDAKGFKWIAIFPYDLWYLEQSWVPYLNALDYPCVYSQYGYDMLKEHVPRLRYYRPRLNGWEYFKPLTGDALLAARRETFPSVPHNAKIFGFVGQNQIRKSPERLIKAFFEAKKVVPDIVLYLHTDLQGIFNLKQIAQSCGAKSGDLVVKQQGVSYARYKMPTVYNAMDYLVNCSMQEGLSWTPIEAMLCGTPVIGSETTAQTELLRDAGVMVQCKDVAFVPMSGNNENVSVESRACRVEDIRDAIIQCANPDIYQKMYGYATEVPNFQWYKKKSIEFANNWMAGTDDINDLLKDASKKRKVKKIEAVLFAQYSSAGDVLMTTQCFKGIKARHKGMKLVYMTQRQFAGIVENNPYLDQVLDWNEQAIKEYLIAYNPHGEKILPGGWNNLDVTLYSMYPYFCNVDSDEILIDPVEPAIDLPKEYVVVHTTGGSKEYRSYAHMNRVLDGLSIPTVQVGGLGDLRTEASIDLCGKLTWRESASVVKNAKAAVVVDSFMSHLAGSVGTDAVVLYGPAPARVVQPRMQHGAKLINLEPDMLKVCAPLSHCWSTPQRGKVKCTSPCINTISPMRVKVALGKLLENISREKLVAQGFDNAFTREKALEELL